MPDARCLILVGEQRRVYLEFKLMPHGAGIYLIPRHSTAFLSLRHIKFEWPGSFTIHDVLSYLRLIVSYLITPNARAISIV